VAKKNKSGGSLQAQLRKVGLVTDKQLRKAQKGIHRQEMRIKQGLEVDEDKIAAEKSREEKLVRDRDSNEERNKQAEKKAVAAQIKQLIGLNSQRETGDVSYNFSDNNKIKKIYISEDNRKQLNKGYLAIVKTAEGYDLVPEKVARKIMDRSEEVVLYLYDRDEDVPDEDDPYKDFKIPDDLEW